VSWLQNWNSLEDFISTFWSKKRDKKSDINDKINEVYELLWDLSDLKAKTIELAKKWAI